MNQLPLTFDAAERLATEVAYKLARKSHPATSREAAGRMIDSGKLGQDQRLALEMVRRFPGRTAKELEALRTDTGEEGRVRKRLRELARAGYITDRREPGAKAVAWWPAVNQDERSGNFAKDAAGITPADQGSDSPAGMSPL